MARRGAIIRSPVYPESCGPSSSDRSREKAKSRVVTNRRTTFVSKDTLKRGPRRARRGAGAGEVRE
jgi:hypothetical protein